MTRKILYLAIPAIALICFAGAATAAEPVTATGDLAFLGAPATSTSMEGDSCGLASGAAEAQPTGNHKNPPPMRACGPCSDPLCQGKNEADICAVGLGITYCLILSDPPQCSDGETYNCSCPGA